MDGNVMKQEINISIWKYFMGRRGYSAMSPHRDSPDEPQRKEKGRAIQTSAQSREKDIFYVRTALWQNLNQRKAWLFQKKAHGL